MTWRFVSSCVAGTSHSRQSLPCQDNCFVTTAAGADGRNWLIVIASDGAGSASRAEAGAEIACEVGGHFLVEAIAAPDVEMTAALAHDVLGAIRAAIDAEAARVEGGMRDFACTLVGAVVGPERAMFFQVGDGAIVVRRDGELQCVFWPESGEYANMTYFVTDELAAQHLHIRVEDSPAEVALMTDGLQRLALVFADQSVHAPFFTPMFRTLLDARSEDCDRLSESLSVFLASDGVNARTDDDKTLILAVEAHEGAP
ncbi:protein phosphatase 2C-like protein [Paraburkholderia sp. BL6669N2]|uniref:PP2C family serine/threonine-protein phosphatase n=1 Tax=Paraburkholderia sp. BL6669N2 TaxID=1938807 RepID=UPI000E27216D|nr:PP2C family serine/threonine-protein phosphatase [Paraburkholderia sp. BL6669N2]REG49567.1 protein phosphatase 2C-like protein [Paraburkholderia sp. BL6669N2]